ncbi:MAG TPA: Ig-like domain-containing protein, partial [Kofleriaceae bacterium]
TSSCRSPMTYRDDCGGERFFRNLPANCGEYANRACQCGGLQNAHLKLTTLLGAGTPITAAPVVTLTAPTGATVTNGQLVTAMASSQRGIGHLELWLNNHKWAEVTGANWGPNGQYTDAPYRLTFPDNVPDGVIDLQVKAFDDINGETDTTITTVTKGAPCADATTCAAGQKCEAGKCFWDAPTGMLGDTCTYNEFCVSGTCTESSIGSYCSQECVVGSEGACPTSFDCIATTETGGVCLPQDNSGGGCCSVGGHEANRAIWAHAGLGLFVLGLVLRRRRARS